MPLYSGQSGQLENRVEHDKAGDITVKGSLAVKNNNKKTLLPTFELFCSRRMFLSQCMLLLIFDSQSYMVVFYY